MEVAPHELAQLLKLAGVGVGPEPEVMSEPDMPGAEIEPEVSVMAIPSDDGAPVGGGCGAPEPEHDHDHGGRMRGIIDMLQGAGEEPIEVEESPPKDDYENASNEFTGHPVDVVDTYDQYSYEPAKNSGMQRRTNSYGDNPLREEDLIKEYTEFKEFPLFEVNWGNQAEVEAEYKRLGLDQGDDPLGGWWDTRGMSDLKIRQAREKRIKQAYKDRPVDRQQDTRIADKGGTGEEEGQAVALLGKDALDDPNWRDNVAAKKQADKEASVANIAAQKAERNRQAEYELQHAGEVDAKTELANTDSDASKVRQQAAADRLARDPRTVANLPVTGDGTAVASNGKVDPALAKAVQQSTDSLPQQTQQQIANQARIDGENSQLATPPKDEIKGWKSVAKFKARKKAQQLATAGKPIQKVSTVAPTGYRAGEVDRGFRQPQPTAPKAVATPTVAPTGYGAGKVDPGFRQPQPTATKAVATPTATTPQVATKKYSGDPLLNPNASPSSSAVKQTVTPTIDKPTTGGKFQRNAGGTDSDTRSTLGNQNKLGSQNAWQRNWHKDQKGMHKVTSGKYSDGLDRLKFLAGI
ncbi:MAG: hypothetical protein CXT73_01195 [Methanobacteriota archaeon]|nr:MAG: hypothetical protein CXT73_01195 [Euryarchaeota archaeon]